MSFTTDAVIAEANRNEAREAIEIIDNATGKMSDEMFDLLVTLEQCEAYNAIRHELFKVRRLVEKFSEKHQPELSRCK